MRERFTVTYETKGVKVIDVWITEGAQLPAQWESMSLKDKDEWLYDNQEESKLKFTDEHQGECVNVLPVTQLKAVI